MVRSIVTIIINQVFIALHVPELGMKKNPPELLVSFFFSKG